MGREIVMTLSIVRNKKNSPKYCGGLPREKNQEEWLSQLRRDIIDSNLSENTNSRWLNETKEGYLLSGGNSEEIQKLEKCFDVAIVAFKRFVLERLQSKEIFTFLEDPYVQFKTVLMDAGFMIDDIRKAVDMIVDDFYAKTRQDFVASQRR
jgi:hypothetical protein